MVAPKGASTCRSKGPKDVWIERTYDYVVASGSLKGKNHRWRWLKILRPDRTKQCPLWSRGKRRYWSSSRRCCLVTVEEGGHEEAQKKQVERKWRKRRRVKKEESERKSLKKWLMASRRWPFCT